MTWTEKPFTRNAAICSSCGAQVAKGERGWTNSEAPAGKRVRCLACGSGNAVTTIDPIAGSSALRQDRRYRGDNNLKGAVGEYRMGQRLHTDLVPGAIVLTDRKVPGDSDANIDHTVIASSGVWLLDAKKWSGPIKYASRLASTSPTMYLSVKGEDRTAHIARLYRLVIPVAQVIGDRNVPLNPAMVFIDGDWALRNSVHLMKKGPYLHEGVYVSTATAIIKAINAPGSLNAEQIATLGGTLDAAMPPR